MLQKDRDNLENPAYANARQVMNALSGAFKKLNLYSESHSVYNNALILLKNSLEQHFSRFGNLNIRISRDMILCDDAVVYQGSAEPTDLVFILHRDGILSFEFQEGLELWELDTLLKILRQHCTLADNAEDDIVTALWEYNLPSILYDAADPELGLPDETRLFHQQSVMHEQEKGAQNKPGAETETDMTNDDPPAGPGVSPLEHRNELFHLTADEREQLRKMVFNQSLVSLQHAHGAFYFQQERLPIRPSNARLFNRMLRFFENRTIHGLHFGPDARSAQPFQIIAFFRMVEQSIGQEGPADWLALQCTRNGLAWVVAIDSSPPANLYDPSLPSRGLSQEDELAASKVQVRKSYAHALSSVQEVARKLTAKQSTGMRTSVRLVQKMVDIISEDETLFLGISTIRRYDDYTYVHSLNVAILSMCLGKQIGLTHNALERLGLCGLVHDLGKVGGIRHDQNPLHAQRKIDHEASGAARAQSQNVGSAFRASHGIRSFRVP